MYFTDPITKQKSVSLTLLWVTFFCSIVFAILTALGYAKDPTQLLEMFYSCAALYLGRRLSFGGNIYSSESNGDKTK